MVKDFFRKSADVFVADVITKGAGFGILAMMTFILQPSDLGKYNALLTAITSLYVMSGLGVALVLQRESARHFMEKDGKLNELLPAGMSVMAISMLVIIILFLKYQETLSRWVFTGLDTQLVNWIPILTLLYFLVQSPLTLILGLGQFKLYAYRNLVEVIVTGVCVLTGGYFWHLHGLMFGLLVAYVINAFLVWLILKRLLLKHSIQMLFKRLRFNSKRILHQGLPYFLGNTFVGAIGNIILVGLFSSHIGYEKLGFLRIGLSLSAILMVVPNAAKTVTVTFMAIHEENSTRLKSIQIRYLFSSIILSTMLLIAVLLPAVNILFGEAYMAGIQVYSFVLLTQVFFSMQQILNSFLAGSGRFVFSGMVNAFVAIFYIVMAFLLIPIFGIVGYYVAFGTSYFLGLIVLISKELSGKNYADRSKIISFMIYSLAALLLTFVIVLNGINWWSSILLVVVSLLYATVCVLITFNSEEKQWFRQLLLRRKQLASE